MYVFKTTGVCAKEIIFDVKENKIENVEFKGGCPGNLLGISQLVKGMNIDHVIEKFEGVPCGNKSTSCPDQFAKALKKLKEKSVESA
ncbi:TIGR03905 family TSCPD domain-containing protein [Peptostreptococcaceae bacterium AGR-M142]